MQQSIQNKNDTKRIHLGIQGFNKALTKKQLTKANKLPKRMQPS